MAVPFDVERLEVTGTATRMIAGVMCEPSSGAAQFALSGNGTLVYSPGGAFDRPSELVWIGRDGKSTPVGNPASPCRIAELSPDGTRIAMIVTGASDAIFVYDIARGTLTRATFEGNANGVSWTSDGENLVYLSDRESGGVFRSRADGSGTPVRLWSDVGLNSGVVIVAGPKPALIYPKGVQGERDIWLRPLEEGAVESPVVQMPFDQSEPRVSPDGRWLAYLSDESGRPEVYVRPFPSGPGRWRISKDGAYGLQWSSDGTRLYFLAGSGVVTGRADTRRVLLSVSVSTDGGFSSGTPEVAFEWDGPVMGQVAPDGERVLTMRWGAPSFHPTEVYAVLNWFDELKQKVPVR
jgi:serine/threonine-protein kinase